MTPGDGRLSNEQYRQRGGGLFRGCLSQLIGLCFIVTDSIVHTVHRSLAKRQDIFIFLYRLRCAIVEHF
jgi:hypothetical protein